MVTRSSRGRLLDVVTSSADRAGARTGRVLLAAALLLLAASALLLWGRYGTAVFADMVAAGLAWCL